LAASDLDHAIAVQILLEARLQRPQRGAAARRSSDDVGREVAVVVGGPHKILICTRVLPRNLISACRLLGTDRRPRTELTGNHRYAVELQRCPRASVEELGTAPLFPYTTLFRSLAASDLDHAVAVQILMEARLQRL